MRYNFYLPRVVNGSLIISFMPHIFVNMSANTDLNRSVRLIDIYVSSCVWKQLVAYPHRGTKPFVAVTGFTHPGM